MTTHGQANAQRWSQPRIFVQPDRTIIKLSNEEVDLLPASVARSELLSNIFDTGSNMPCWDAALEVRAEALQQWLSHVQPGVITAHKHGSACSIACLVSLEDVRHAGVLRVVANSTKPTPARPTTSEAALQAAAPHPSSTRKTKRVATREQPIRHAKRKALDEKSMAPAVLSRMNCSESQGSPKVHKRAASIQQEAWARCLLIQASDVLMDEQTEAEACRALGAVLEMEADYVLEKFSNRKPVMAGKVLAALSEDLAIKVLQAIHRPFSDLLRYLSTTPFRPHLLRIHHPSIDASASLTLGATSVSALAMPALLEPMATLTHLQSLSFSGQPLVHLHGWVDHKLLTLEHALCVLPRLTHLCLRDTALRSCADSLAAALPALPHLHTLDASGNRLDGAFDKLAAALPAATALRTLLLDGAATAGPALCELGAALRGLPQLEVLSIGAPRMLDSSYQLHAYHPEPPYGHVSTEELMHDVLAPLRSMGALSALTFTYKLPHSISCAIAPAVASLTQLHHLRLHSFDLCNLPCIDSDGEIDATHSTQLTSHYSDGERMSKPVLAAPGCGLSLLLGLTSLDLTAASTVRVRGRSINVGALMGALMLSLEGLPQLQALELPCACLSSSDCMTIMRAVRQLTCLTKVSVRATTDSCAPGLHELAAGMAQQQSLRHIRAPLLLSHRRVENDPAFEDEDEDEMEEGEPGFPVSEAAAALAQAAAEKAVEVDLHCCERLMREFTDEAYTATAREVLDRVLPLCCSLRSYGFSGVQLDLIGSSLDRMSALTSLTLQVMAEYANDAWNAEQCGGHEQLLRQLGLLTGLRSLAIESEVCGILGVCPAFCEQLSCLRQLSSLTVAVRGRDHECVPKVIDSCGSLPCLHSLRLQLLEHLPHREEGHVVQEPWWWAAAGAPAGWDLGKLTSLQTLLVLNHSNLNDDEAFWGSLFQLSRLQSLHLNDYIDDRHLHMLGYRMHHFGGLVLRDLHLTGQWPRYEACGVSTDCAELRVDCDRYEGLRRVWPW